MSTFSDFDVEVQNTRDRNVEQFNGSVTTAGVPVTITPSTGTITGVIVSNPTRGPNANGSTDVVLVSIDGTNYMALSRGESLNVDDIYVTSIKIDANNNGTNYETVILRDEA